MNTTTPTQGTGSDDPSVVARIFEIVSHPELPASSLAKELSRLEEEFGASVYSELLYLMAHLSFDAENARAHWHNILEERQSMEQRLGSPVDVRVAMVSYFVDVNRQLENPKIMELKLFQETQASVYRDELTGLFNFRYLREHLPREIQRVDRYGATLSLFMIDVDDFKLYNDLYGHPSGNRVLQTISGIITDSIRATDTAVRYGGEEFVLILPSTPKSEARVVAERIRLSIEMDALTQPEHQPGSSLTTSFGLATYPADATQADDLIRCADSAMYLAKSRGKNQVCLFGEDRRSFRRIDAELEGRYCELSSDCYPFKTLDVSEGGLLLLAKQSLKVGSLLELKLVLPTTDTEIECSGRVVRVEEQERGTYAIALRFAEMSQQDRFQLMSFIRGNRLRAVP